MDTGDGETPRPVLRPAGKKRRDFTVERDNDAYVVRGERIERWIRMTDLSNDDAVRYLQGRLQAAGVERALIAAGAREGDVVDLGGFVFDFTPEIRDLPPEELAAMDAKELAELEAESGVDEP